MALAFLKKTQMESKRQQKFARQIQKDLSDIFQKELQNDFGGAFVTITQVRMSPDLGLARVYVSFLLAKDKEATLNEIREKGRFIRNALSQRIRHQVRIIPELTFFLDDTAEYASQMEALFAKIEIPPLKEGEKIEL